ncbi:hypothetical protein PHYBLDRAFT_68996 [Phycomyces blakesleeanus NRRL 1555(-)]|uniref:Uncharacterized protein n=1 Tax=Phycomyces blakesleeanus (strain ATCC 8743b / DSM 1359 / FGSC 10004 / NBRC 33097 / NRRL 1555) TaxID=763407 RepID=A0A167KML9_PHYB8|nr:hypothetical protein PHYBLDRAFT_68996 [Phycomyces blakesleeanus NRRL 1555(-)]OAD68437.1 hypothetical protein PHYBLDRAFT_68996 [Phycomyces blakesleeanus NRRL 1555(-)]|eukprot:XP_018286477.1 hypothetical protein PHYBLDRAFT_68996 [Phycomyces blakesleeanus NRRL 1555(-)]
MGNIEGIKLTPILRNSFSVAIFVVVFTGFRGTTSPYGARHFLIFSFVLCKYCSYEQDDQTRCGDPDTWLLDLLHLRTYSYYYISTVIMTAHVYPFSSYLSKPRIVDMNANDITNEQIHEFLKRTRALNITGRARDCTARYELPEEILHDMEESSKSALRNNLQKFQKDTLQYDGGDWTKSGALNRIFQNEVKRFQMDALTIMIPAIGEALLHVQYVQRDLAKHLGGKAQRWELPCPLSSEAMLDLAWWTTTAKTTTGLPIQKSPPCPPAVTIYVDASNTGWGVLWWLKSKKFLRGRIEDLR